MPPETPGLILPHFDHICDFVNESFHIEGIRLSRYDLERHADHHIAWLKYEFINTEALRHITFTIQHGARLRDKSGLNVSVGSHLPPVGGPHIAGHLSLLLSAIADDTISPYGNHRAYEQLHPFTDGNGCSGRFLWLWQMCRHHGYTASLPFLQCWYYQSLSESPT